MKNTTL